MELSVEKSQRLMAEIRQSVQSSKKWTGRAALSDRVVAAMATVPRPLFVDDENATFAYANHALRIRNWHWLGLPNRSAG